MPDALPLGLPLDLPFDLPFEDVPSPGQEPRPFRIRPGLRPLDPSAWLVFDGDPADEDGRAAELAEKRRLLAERHDDVVAVLPGTEAAAQEVLDAVTAHLRAHGRDVPPPDPSLHPIDAAGRLVPDDLCLHLPATTGPDGSAGFLLAAASVCFPLRWDLRSKLGRTVAAIHDPVPRYAGDAAAAVDRVLGRLRPDAPLWRRNWTVVDDPALHQRSGTDRTDPNAAITIETVATHAWLRVERQTLRAFPVHGSVLFTIRTYQRPLGALAAEPVLAARLAATIRALPPDVAAYKSLPTLAGPVLAWLDAVAAGHPGCGEPPGS